MGTGSLLQGDLLRQSLRSCLDYAGSNGEGRRSCCLQHEHVPGCARNDGPQFGNFEIAYSTRRMTVNAVLMHVQEVLLWS